jgi:hypothetical protein
MMMRGAAAASSGNCGEAGVQAGGAVKHCSDTVHYYFMLFQEGFLVFCGCICTPPSVIVASPLGGNATACDHEKFLVGKTYENCTALGHLIATLY